MITVKDPDTVIDALARALAQADPLGVIQMAAVALKPGPTTDKLAALRALAGIINEDDAVTVLRAAADFFDASTPSPSAASLPAGAAPGCNAVVAPAEPPGAPNSKEAAA